MATKAYVVKYQKNKTQPEQRYLFFKKTEAIQFARLKVARFEEIPNEQVNCKLGTVATGYVGIVARTSGFGDASAFCHIWTYEAGDLIV